MTHHEGKFLPRPTPETAAYWEGCRNRELLLQCCRQCGSYQFYPRVICTTCTGNELEWAKSTGRGKILTFTVVRRAVSEAYVADVPYVIALIELEEGPIMMSVVEGCDFGDLETGMPVEVFFDKWSDEITMPKFRPAP